MKRNKIVAGNWKMNKLYDEGITLAASVCKAIASGVETRTGVIPLVVMAPPSTLLKEIAEMAISVPGVAIAAQNASSEVAGAFTGEISASMIGSAGATHVIIGHSERRTLFGESDEILSKKAQRVLDAGLTLIYCIGEVLQERMDGRHFEVIDLQLQKGLLQVDPSLFSRVIIAYEPVWAIGTGQNATPAQAEEIHAFIRSRLKEAFGDEIADATSVIYGGSCKPDNAAALFTQPNVDGGLIGGASLNPDDFLAIIQAI
jgi:triosephosphate isomerase (TIM)